MVDDINNDWRHGSYKYPVTVALRKAIDQWKDDRDYSWTEDGGPDDKAILDDGTILGKAEAFEMIEAFATAFFETSEYLGKTKLLEELAGQMNFFDEYTVLYDYVKEHFQASLAKKAIKILEEGAGRLLSLLWELVVVKQLDLTLPIKDFLQLVMRSYIWGFDAECIILCRSAMEKTIKDKVTDEMCENNQQGYTLFDRIEVAKIEGLIDKEIAKIADAIRLRGNAIVHNSPRLTETVSKTIKETVRVIAVVTGARDPYGPPDWLK